MRHDPSATLREMLNAANRAVERLGSDSEEQFLGNEDQQWVLFSQIVILGEAANRISREHQATMPEIPWPAVISMRNRIIHGCDSID